MKGGHNMRRPHLKVGRINTCELRTWAQLKALDENEHGNIVGWLVRLSDGFAVFVPTGTVRSMHRAPAAAWPVYLEDPDD